MDMNSYVNEAMLRVYRLNRLNERKLFQKMSEVDYFAIWGIYRHSGTGEGERRIYLEDIEKNMGIPMRGITMLARGLSEKGLVEWKYDGTGEDGTYILLTDKGRNAAMDQQRDLIAYYQKAIERFGKERFERLLGELEELEGMLGEEAEKRGEE